MSTSVQKNPQGPFWPAGCILVPTPGTPVRITNLIDPNNYNAPETLTSVNSDEYTRVCQQIFFQGWTTNGASGGHGLVFNTGNVYIIQQGGSGSNNRDDSGSILKILQPGENFYLSAAALNRNVFSPYEIWIDADNANDGALITLLVQ